MFKNLTWNIVASLYLDKLEERFNYNLKRKCQNMYLKNLTIWMILKTTLTMIKKILKKIKKCQIEI